MFLLDRILLALFFSPTFAVSGAKFDTGGIPIRLSKQDSTGTPFVVDSFALLIRHHPTLHNVDGDLMLSKQQQQHPIIATRSIQVGEELFLSYNNHPHSHLKSKDVQRTPHHVDSNVNNNDHPVFHNIPLLEDYNIADEIIQEQLQLFKATKQHLQNKRRQEIGYGLRSTQRAVRRFNSKVASLLPTIANEMIEYRGGKTTQLIGISNNTHRSLALNGMCFDDMKQQQSNQASTPTTTLVAKRAIKNQTVAFPIPLYVSQQYDGSIDRSCSASSGGDDDAADDATTTTTGECTSIDSSGNSHDNIKTDGPCMTGTETSLLFCPLLFGSFRIIPYPPRDQHDGSISSENDDDYEKPNIEIKWSDRNFFNEKIKIQSIKTITTVSLKRYTKTQQKLTLGTTFSTPHSVKNI